MADRITDDLLQTLAAGDPIAMLLVATQGDPVGRELRAMAAELLAARARIAKLEQEPPMAMIDLGVGVNWKGLHEDMQRLRAERDAARAEVAAVDAAISDRGVAERDCRLPVAERIDNILVELKECSFEFGTAAMENERLCAEVERLRAEAAKCDALRARVAVLEWGLAQLVLEGEDAAFDPLQDRLQRCGIMPTQAALDAAKDPNQ